MALEQEEQRLRMELRRKNSALQNAISDAAVQKRLAESPDQSADKRAKARAKYNELQSQVASLRAEVKKLEGSVKKEQSRKNATEVKKNYERLKSQYDVMLDKNSPEAKALAEKVNAEVTKLNNAYKNSGSSTRVTPITAPVATSAAQSAAERGRSATRASRTSVTAAKDNVAKTPAGDGATGDKKITGDKGKKTPEDKPKTKEQRYADAIATAVEKYNMPDIIFKNVDSLRLLLEKYVDNKLTDQQFALELQNDPWYRSNSAEIKARYVQLYNYEDLVKKGLATGTTDYEQQLNKIVRGIQTKARELNGIEIPDDQAKLMAKDLYIYNLDGDPAVLTERLVRFIRPSGGMIAGQPTVGYSGQALQNYQALQAIAKANGFKLEDILPKDITGKAMTAEGTLEQLALGKIDINRLAQDVRKLAAIGQSDYVKDLLGQGYDLENIYAPYRSTMANILELDPNTISLNDPALRMGISKDGDMNLYDFEKSLRKDNRWQYTQQARGEVADVALRVLRDFGFTG